MGINHDAINKWYNYFIGMDIIFNTLMFDIWKREEEEQGKRRIHINHWLHTADEAIIISKTTRIALITRQTGICTQELTNLEGAIGLLAFIEIAMAPVKILVDGLLEELGIAVRTTGFAAALTRAKVPSASLMRTGGLHDTFSAREQRKITTIRHSFTIPFNTIIMAKGQKDTSEGIAW